MLFRMDPRSSTPLYEQIIYQIKNMCSSGILQPGEQLPSIRELSSQMVVNPNTVSKAYQELEKIGLLFTIQGKGTFVSSSPPLFAPPEKQKKLQEELKQLIVDCHFAGVSRERFLEWTEQSYREMRDTQQ
jgi:GntR family transcriptional regulator